MHNSVLVYAPLTRPIAIDHTHLVSITATSSIADAPLSARSPSQAMVAVFNKGDRVGPPCHGGPGGPGTAMPASHPTPLTHGHE